MNCNPISSSNNLFNTESKVLKNEIEQYSLEDFIEAVMNECSDSEDEEILSEENKKLKNDWEILLKEIEGKIFELPQKKEIIEKLYQRFASYIFSYVTLDDIPNKEGTISSTLFYSYLLPQNGIYGLPDFYQHVQAYPPITEAIDKSKFFSIFKTKH